MLFACKSPTAVTHSIFERKLRISLIWPDLLFLSLKGGNKCMREGAKEEGEGDTRGSGKHTEHIKSRQPTALPIFPTLQLLFHTLSLLDDSIVEPSSGGVEFRD
eukprot:1380827-Amorphochlora_amoeboformis.AAC.1